MKSLLSTPKIIFVSATILIAAAARLLPHLPNFTPIAAMALFGGAYLSDKRMAFFIPFLALFLSDLVLGFSASMVPVYACFAFTVLLGIFIKENVNPLSIAGSALVSSIVFFLVTNLPIWYTGLQLYPNTFEGVMMSYTAALPFFANSLAGDLFYSAILFSTFYLAEKNIPMLSKVRA